LRAATRGDFESPRRFAVALASGAFAGVGGRGGLVESTEDLYIRVLIRLWLVKLGFFSPSCSLSSLAALSWLSSGACSGAAAAAWWPCSAQASPTSGLKPRSSVVHRCYATDGAGWLLWLGRWPCRGAARRAPSGTAACSSWAVRQGFFFLGSVSSGRRRGRAEDDSDIYGGFPDFAGGDGTSKDFELAGFGVLVPLDLVESAFCSFLFFAGSFLDAFAGVVFTGFLYLQGVFFWRFGSTDSMKPGWFLPTTRVGGSAPLLGVSSAGVLGILAATGAFDFSKAGDAMANTIGHLWKPGVQCQESMSWMCYSRRRLKVMSLRRLGDRLQTKDSGRRWRGTPGDGYKDLNVFLIFIKDVFV